MKRTILAGPVCNVFGDILSELLRNNIEVKALVEFPEKFMVTNDLLTVSRLDVADKKNLEASLSGYGKAVFAFDDNLENDADAMLALEHYPEMINAAIAGGVKKLVVVASPESEAFFAGHLARHTDIDAKFISTEGDFAGKVLDNIA